MRNRYHTDIGYVFKTIFFIKIFFLRKTNNNNVQIDKIILPARRSSFIDHLTQMLSVLK